MSTMTLFTIGFSKKSAEEFFTLLGKAGVRRMIDIRLNNVSQLAGFAKKDDLRFFLKAIGGIDYLDMRCCAAGPSATKAMLVEASKTSIDPKLWITAPLIGVNRPASPAGCRSKNRAYGKPLRSGFIGNVPKPARVVVRLEICGVRV